LLKEEKEKATELQLCPRKGPLLCRPVKVSVLVQLGFGSAGLAIALEAAVS
jgi:hypothetical protein